MAALVVAIGLGGLASTLIAQDTTRATVPDSIARAPQTSATRAGRDTLRVIQDTGRVISPCDGRIVRAIQIRPRTPYYAGFGGQWQPLARALTAVHPVTRPEVIRSFLALAVGEPCTEVRRAESERILRAQPFLSEVRVTTFDDRNGGIRVSVVTVDEVSLLGGLSVRSQAPHVTAARLGDGNLVGQGLSVVADWADGLGLRDRFGGRITDYAVFGRPYEMSLVGTRDELGGYWTGTFVHPFFTDLQRIAWIVQIGERRNYVNFLNATTPLTPNLDLRRRFAQIGGVGRVQGVPGHLELFGLSISDEREAPGSQAVVLPPGEAVRPDTNPALVAQYRQLNATRINAIAGLRNIRFLRVKGFDALDGEQDIKLGTEVGVVGGRSLLLPGRTSNDVLLATSIYSGIGSSNYLLAVQASGESRNDLSSNVWDDIFVSGRAALYWKPARPHTVIISEEYSLGLDARLPFTLVLADPRGGVRGFSSSLVAGGERTVTRFEERWLIGPFKDLGDIGVAGFADVGRIWAQGVPYGVNSPTAVGLGFSFLAAVPVHSKRLWRMDFAFPVTRDPNARFQIRFASTNGAEVFYITPRDIALARTQSVPTQIFEYPTP
jgi:hypothetical protein